MRRWCGLTKAKKPADKQVLEKIERVLVIKSQLSVLMQIVIYALSLKYKSGRTAFDKTRQKLIAGELEDVNEPFIEAALPYA